MARYRVVWKRSAVKELRALSKNAVERIVKAVEQLSANPYGVGVRQAGQALVLPNWLASPSYGVAVALLFALRIGPEERMMVEEFGKEYKAYMSRTKRLVPGVW